MKKVVQSVLALLPVFLLCFSCTAPRTNPSILLADWAAYLQGDYKVRPGDQLQLSVQGVPELGLTIQVDPQGQAAFPRVGVITCKEKSVSILRGEVQRAYGKILTGPQVSLSLLVPVEQVVYVGGEMRGRSMMNGVPYQPGLTLFRAILAAGGFDPVTAKTNEVLLMRNGRDGKYHQYRIDLDKIAHHGAPDVRLLPNDAIFVQTCAGADVANFVELYIRRMLPISPGSVAGSYLGSQWN